MRDYAPVIADMQHRLYQLSETAKAASTTQIDGTTYQIDGNMQAIATLADAVFVLSEIVQEQVK